MRKWINLLNEFQKSSSDPTIVGDSGGLPPLEDDDGEGGRNNGLILVFNILWDTDEEGLPARVKIPIEELDDVTFPSEDGGPDGDMMTRIGDWLTENIHSNLSDFDWTVI